MNPKILYLSVIPFHALVTLLVMSVGLLAWKPSSWPYALAIFCGFLAAFIDLHSDEIQLPILLLLAFSFFLGFTNPISAWRWGLLVGLWIPLVNPLRYMSSPETFSISQSLVSVIAFCFSFFGSYGGVILGKFRPVLSSSPL